VVRAGPTAAPSDTRRTRPTARNGRTSPRRCCPWRRRTSRGGQDTPWPSSSNVNIPLLTIAALQFNARMYPAAIKGDEAILCKVIGQDNGVSVKAPNPNHGADPAGPADRSETGSRSPTPKARWSRSGRFRRVQGQAGTAGQRVSEHRPVLPHGGMGSRHRRDDDAAADRRLCIPQGLVRQEGRAVGDGPGASPARQRGRELARILARITEEIPDIYPFEISCKQREGITSMSIWHHRGRRGQAAASGAASVAGSRRRRLRRTLHRDRRQGEPEGSPRRKQFLERDIEVGRRQADRITAGRST
jgi:hypothetical protein